ncbi:MacB family efflux pump subunit [Bartonella ancashensis]|uniref:Pyoverdine export ATP-binding/permease protein PvdT n=1 Tax=Bartonella ancashensis TaxID=1318743 RepID=A0A0M4M2P1_9HYPH|nr:MacB family efflux pump subunit [Bartonella ancashensis]ALE03174.1 Macrolide export ATP-binding/permease protein MacB [Bartonella ancashensis]
MQAEPTETDAILFLEGVEREFRVGEEAVRVLKNINLTIRRGEMVAIVGASGSGKSTLMNILGCLDRPSSGRYYVSGKEIASLSADDLSALRRNHFGFIFQRYHLLGMLTALGNVEMPAIYAQCLPGVRKKRAQSLLTRLGMSDRMQHYPNQLSGGQQQRVSIARALMNDADIILADEPTGALDRQSGEEVLRILDELHQDGRTIIIVTHDMHVAKRAERIIELSDGKIIADSLSKTHQDQDNEREENTQKEHRQISEIKDPLITNHKLGFVHLFIDRFRESFMMALLAMQAHRMRTFLTMLGVIIGIFSVVVMVSLGAGTQRKLLEIFQGFGTNTLTILPGKDFSDRQAEKITSLVEADAEALSQLFYVTGATPQISASSTVNYGSIEVGAVIMGVGEQFFATQGFKVIEGQTFDQRSIHERAIDLVIERSAISTLFPNESGSAIGKIIRIGQVPARIIGVVAPHQESGPSNTLQIYMPYTALQTRFLGTTSVRAITLKIADNVDSRLAEAAVQRFLIKRHGQKDFFIQNSETFLEHLMAGTRVLTMLVASIATISLIVGGIGVMNIMLVTVTERISEIGVRMAVGARQSDILQQFLIEAILVCAIGGILGVLLGFSVGGLFVLFDAPIRLVYTFNLIVSAVLFAGFIGICFGFFPARKASQLDPVIALARD